MSFIDMMANDVWSDADIVSRTEAIIRSEFPQQEQDILLRKVVAFTLGTYTMSAGEMDALDRFTQLSIQAKAAADAARADMALLQRVLDYEQSDKANPPDADIADLYDMRNVPVPEPVAPEGPQGAPEGAGDDE